MGQPWVSLGAATAPLRAIQNAQPAMINAWGRAGNAFQDGWNEGQNRRRVQEKDAFSRKQQMEASARASQALDLNRQRFQAQQKRDLEMAEHRKMKADQNRKLFDLQIQDRQRKTQVEDDRKKAWGEIADLKAGGDTQGAALRALRMGDSRLYAQLDAGKLQRQQKELGIARQTQALIAAAKTPEEFDAILKQLEAQGADVSAYQGGGLRAQRQMQMDLKRQLQQAEATAKRMQWALKQKQLRQGDRKLDLEGRKLDIEQEKLANPASKGMFETPAKQLQFEQGLRKEYTKTAKTFIDVRDAYGRIKTTASNPSPAGDISMIFNYMKMLDPGSTVREGEFATAAQAGSLPTQLMNQYNQVVNGQRLTESQRADFLAQAERLYAMQQGNYQQLRNQYVDIAKRAGVDPRQVILDMEMPQGGKPQLPPAQGGQQPSAAPQRQPQQQPQQARTVPPQAIQFLRQNPSPGVIQQFEQKYGVPAQGFIAN